MKRAVKNDEKARSNRLHGFLFIALVVGTASLSFLFPLMVAYMSQILQARSLIQAALFTFTFTGLMLLDSMLEETEQEHPAIVIKKSRVG